MDSKPLPFSKPLVGISDKALAIHHDKLYVGYVNKANELGEKLVALRKSGNYEGNATYSELRSLKSEETFATNAIYLHEWYFDILGGTGNISDAPELSKALVEKWDSLEESIKYMSACGMAARGWAVLCWDIKGQSLRQYNADSHNQGGVWGCVPIVTLDCYEHAYFMDYGSDKKKYIEDFWKNMDWAKAEALYVKAREFVL